MFCSLAHPAPANPCWQSVCPASCRRSPARKPWRPLKFYSIAGQLPQGRGLISARPFRSPHHSASAAALAGGGAQFRPGECSLANCGVLFLDELPEFSRESLEVLRQPLEDGQITVSRAAGSATYPSHFQLVAAMNPCKCGYYGHPTRQCTCSPSAVRQYRSRVSGPLLDRIDLCVEMDPIAFDELHTAAPSESSAELRKQVLPPAPFRPSATLRRALRECTATPS